MQEATWVVVVLKYNYIRLEFYYEITFWEIEVQQGMFFEVVLELLSSVLGSLI